VLQLEYFHICESVLVDVETNSTSLIKIIEGLSVDQLPGIIPAISIVSMWRISEEDCDREQNGKRRYYIAR
jgi:hypothetical protein